LLRPITLHECRHTFASLLIHSGANPKAIQQFMGHSKIQTTFDVYGRLLPGSHDEVRKRMDAYLRGDGAWLDGSDRAAILIGMPLISRMRSGRVRRLEEQMRAMNSKIDAMAETFESRRADDEAAAIAAERIRSGAAAIKEDGAEALASLGIKLPEG
jgi:hypothetical protein